MNSKVQGLKAIAFSNVIVNDKHTKPTIGLKESVGFKFKEGKCSELRLKLRFQSGQYFCNITQDGFESDCPERKS